MATDTQDNTRPNPTRAGWNWDPTPAAAKPDRETYEASRRAELGLICLIDIKRRQLLGCCGPLKTENSSD
jgi:hypothetical protein